ncbi:MAG: putative metalloprotease CJM1_0395 family protein [Marinobacter sp.]
MMISGALPSQAPAYPLPSPGGPPSADTSSGEPRAGDIDQKAPARDEPAKNRSADRESQAGERSRRQNSEADNPQGLDEAELKELTDLKARDREVRAHEAAHQAVGGQYAGAISYVYERGPDGTQYAVGGEVSIDTSPVQGDPQATIEKMRVVRAAALAPAEPSPQDRAVAAEAMQLMLQARSELSSELGDRRESSDAANAYQSVSGIVAPDAVTEESDSAFQATA